MTPNLDEIRRALAAASKTSGAMRSRNELGDETIEDLDYVSQARKEMIEQLEAERDAALAELAETRHESAERLTMSARAHTARKKERDAALAEVERIKDINALNGRRCLAWRACADQLADRLDWRDDRSVLVDADKEALAVYERLKGQA